MFYSASHSDGSSLESEALDSNSNSTTDSLYINGNTSIGMYVYANSGTNTTHVITIQISMNGSDWQDSSYTVTGAGFVEGTTSAQYIRGKVTTAQGALSTCDIHIASK